MDSQVNPHQKKGGSRSAGMSRVRRMLKGGRPSGSGEADTGSTQSKTKSKQVRTAREKKQRGSKKVVMKSKEKISPGPAGANQSMMQFPTATAVQENQSPATLATPREGLPKEKDTSKSKSEKISPDAKEKKDPILCEAGRKFIDNNMNTAKVESEFAALQAIDVKKTSTVFAANPDKNRCQKSVVYDENRVVLNRSKMDRPNYINASRISLSDFRCNAIIAQMPLPKQDNKDVEDFWYMIYQEKITVMFCMCTLNEIETMFPQKKGEFHYYGKMFVNNRKVENEVQLKNSNIVYLEVLPDGNSDSVLCKVIHYKNWISGHRLRGANDWPRIIKEFFNEVTVGYPNIAAVSLNGDGRACATMAAVAATVSIVQGHEPNIFDIMKQIKEQRYGATECYYDYLSVYILVTYYIQKKVLEPTVQQKARTLLKAFHDIPTVRAHKHDGKSTC